MKKTLLLLTAGLCSSLLIVELTARAYIWWRGGNSDTEVLQATVRAGDLFRDIALIHPYFGLATRPGNTVLEGPASFRLEALADMPVDARIWNQLKVNNHGFYSRYDYPYRIDSGKDFVIGTFGGSVATYFSVVGAPRLVEMLTRDRLLRDRNIVLLNFSQSGFKQPQQALIFAYFLGLGQHFDAVVNIDGFNEAALSLAENWHNGIDISFPRSYPKGIDVRLAHPTDAEIEWQAELVSLRRSAAKWARLRKQTRSAFLALAFNRLERRTRNRIQGTLAAHPKVASDDDFLVVRPPPTEQSPAELIERIGSLWENNSLTMHALAAAKGIKYVQILQPNQYFSDRRFTPEERKIAIIEDHIYAHPVRAIYPVLLRKLQGLRERGVSTVSGLQIFDHEPEQAYLDSCCHYTKRGNELLADLVAKTLIQTLRSDELEQPLFGDRRDMRPSTLACP